VLLCLNLEQVEQQLRVQCAISSSTTIASVGLLPRNRILPQQETKPSFQINSKTPQVQGLSNSSSSSSSKSLLNSSNTSSSKNKQLKKNKNAENDFEGNRKRWKSKDKRKSYRSSSRRSIDNRSS
jgi:hypothetical protein